MESHDRANMRDSLQYIHSPYIWGSHGDAISNAQSGEHEVGYMVQWVPLIYTA